MESKVRLLIKYIMVVLLMSLLTGCVSDTFFTNPSDGKLKDQPEIKKNTAVYYDFEEVLIPTDMEIVDNKTMVVSSPGFTSGIITLKGRVEKRSLFNFFNNNMQKDNWNIISQIKSPGTTIMVFQKIGRTAVITIRDEQFNTYVEVGVAPTVEMGMAPPELPNQTENTDFSQSVIVE
jgi:hypothetical protein